MGAWIEISLGRDAFEGDNVAPYMGAWIEIKIKQINEQLVSVAPYMGAWIEISVDSLIARRLCCRTLHGCVD